MHFDLIVIGTGLAGLMAAKTAVEKGQKVLIVGKGTGNLLLFSNTIDILGDMQEETNLHDGLYLWMKNHPEHPYSRVELDNMLHALSSFSSLFDGPYSFRSMGDRNCLVPTGIGTFRPTYLIPTTMMSGSSLGDGNTLVVGFEGLKDFHARYIANGFGCRGETIPLLESLAQEITPTALSRLMEDPPFREKVAKEMANRLKEETRIGLPAVLGLQQPVAVKMSLEEITGAEVFEIPTLPPSIPGKRIFNRFREWLIQRGATFLMGHPVSNVSVQERRCQGIQVLHPPVSTFFSGDRFILATGRFMGGGLAAEEERISEPIFHLPVTQPADRNDWFGKSFFSQHPLHPSGILTDSSLRPVDPVGNLLFENVWVAGSILAHHNLIQEKSREGIEIGTGYMTAKHALEE